MMKYDAIVISLCAEEGEEVKKKKKKKEGRERKFSSTSPREQMDDFVYHFR